MNSFGVTLVVRARHYGNRITSGTIVCGARRRPGRGAGAGRRRPARACGRAQHIYTPARARDAAGAAAPSQRSSRAPALHLMPPRLGETGVPRSDPAVLLGWSWSRVRCSFSARGRRVDMLCLRFCAQRRQPRRRQVCARRDALSSWREVRRPVPRRPGPSTRARDRRRRSEAPPATSAPPLLL
mgnify:CR=1 FL=1